MKDYILNNKRIVLWLILAIVAAIFCFISCDKDDTKLSIKYTISGTVYDSVGNPLEGVNICLHDTVNSIIVNSLTDMNGNYVCTVDSNWSGKIVPAKVGGFVFKPSVWYYNNVSFDYSQQDYWQLKKSKLYCFHCSSPIMPNINLLYYTIEDKQKIIDWRIKYLQDTLICTEINCNTM